MKLKVAPFVTTALALICLALSPAAHAQTLAAITGVVTDQTGAVVPKVQVTLRNPQTGVSYAGMTNSGGSYTIREVKPGPGYAIEFTRAGFNKVIISGLYLNVDTTRSQNVSLAVGATHQTVQVSAANQNVTLNTTDATVGNNFQVQFLDDLPVQNRSRPSALLTMQPGVTLEGAVTGARTDQNNVTLDGLEMNDNATGQFLVIVGNAPVDSVQEFRGTTAGQLASAGQGAGGQFELVTRSGTNQFHGGINEYHRDTALEANDWFNNHNGTPRPPLIRNQFGGNIGGPILKDKLFFFFDYNGRRDTLSRLEERTVPLDSFRNGNLGYVTNHGSVAYLDAAQVAALDPAGIGYDSALMDLFNKRFPHANDLSGAAGDLVNTGGYRFNAPFPLKENDSVLRLDYTLNSRMKLFAVAHNARENSTETAIQFPGDPETYPFLDKSYSWAVGHTWAISTNKVNQAEFGVTFENYQFPVTYNPQGLDQYSYAGFSGPYGSGSNTQLRTYPIPIVRDDFSWDKGSHNFTFGGTFKWETPNEYAAENFNFPSVGVTGNTKFTALTPNLRPADIGTSTSDTSIYDDVFSTALGAVAEVSSNFNYNNKGDVQPQGSGLDLVYRYYETELYFGDSWKINPHLTLSYGVRYQNYTVPYERHGEEAVANIGFDQYFADRNAQSRQGIEGYDAIPLYTYSLGGKANNAPGYFKPANKNFAPRIAFAYNPSFSSKTVFHGGMGIIYDHSIINALQFQQTQSSYMFEASNVNLFGTAGNPTATLMSAPRFGGGTPPPPSAPTITNPFTPYVDASGEPIGLPNGEFNLVIDKNLKNPYSMQYNFGVQHEFPQGYILKMDYVGRLGRRLLAEADGSQLIDFPDNTGQSDQTMAGAMAGMTTQLRQNASLGALNDILSLSPQPWFEDVTAPGIGVANGFANNTQFIAYNVYPYGNFGDFADSMFLLSAFGMLPPNVGMASQFAGNQVWTNKGSSSYNALLVTLHKNAGYGLQFDLNYTWSHSIDNVSTIANSIAASNGYGWICDVNRPRECRGNSDFDVTNYLNGNFIYNLPFGRGRMFGAADPRWLDEIVGGWLVSGIPSWHTGVAYNASSNAFVAGFANNAPATLIGSISTLKTKVHVGSDGTVNAFADSGAADAAFTGPTGFNIGSRNNLRGPGYFNMDLGLGKTFPIAERLHLKFRVDAFNAFNHPNFNTPSATDITESNGVPFGTITSTYVPNSSDISARVLQGALRLEF